VVKGERLSIGGVDDSDAGEEETQIATFCGGWCCSLFML